jgi:hypothetical protein
VPKKPNYSFEKRKKELDRKAKKEEKLRRRREGGGLDQEGDELSSTDGSLGETADPGAPPLAE